MSYAPKLKKRKVYGHAKAAPKSLSVQCKRAVTDWMLLLVERSSNRFWYNASRHRYHLYNNLAAVLRQELLDDLIPCGQENEWRFPCLSATDRIRCKLHSECILLWDKLPRYIKLLFSPDSSHLRVDLRKVRLEDHAQVIAGICDVITAKTDVTRLTELVLCGGTSHTDTLCRQIEDLSKNLRLSKPTKLKKLHLPLVTDFVVRELSELPALESLVFDRAVHLTHNGLEYLTRGPTRSTLRVLEVGLFEGGPRHYDKVDLARFLGKMDDLRQLRFHDENRVMVNDGQGHQLNQAARVTADYFVYSGFRMRLVDRRIRNNAPEAATAGLRLDSLQVVDRALNPRYIIEAAPGTKELAIDWQEELAHYPWHHYARDWFTRMVNTEEWQEVSGRLQSLSVVFPTEYLSGAYSLPHPDCQKMLANCGSNLTSLSLSGAGLSGEFLRLDSLLGQCQSLVSLKLDNCRVHIEPMPFVHRNPTMKVFHFVGGFATSTPLLISLIATTLFNLVELRMQPHARGSPGGSRQWWGAEGGQHQDWARPAAAAAAAEADNSNSAVISPTELFVLGEMRQLRRLSAALSASDFTSNMPQMFFILSNGFPALQTFVMSWCCRTLGAYPNNDIMYKMSWLKSFLKAENIGVDVGLDFAHHSAIFEASKVRPDNMDAFVNY